MRKEKANYKIEISVPFSVKHSSSLWNQISEA